MRKWSGQAWLDYKDQESIRKDECFIKIISTHKLVIGGAKGYAAENTFTSFQKKRLIFMLIF